MFVRTRPRLYMFVMFVYETVYMRYCKGTAHLYEGLLVQMVTGPKSHWSRGSLVKYPLVRRSTDLKNLTKTKNLYNM